MSRFATGGSTVQFGPGPITYAVRALIIANVAIFIPTFFAQSFVFDSFGLVPELVLTRVWVWQVATYAFLHADAVHILFNMLIVWMFGVDLERRWGAAGFTKYYMVCAIGAAMTVIVVSLLPYEGPRAMYSAVTVGASGACYGLLLAWGVLYPTRQLLLFFVFPVQARYAVMIFGALAFFSSLSSSGGIVSHFAHLGGLVAGYLYLKGAKGLRYSMQSAVTRFRFMRARRKFKVHEGGKGPTVH